MTYFPENYFPYLSKTEVMLKIMLRPVLELSYIKSDPCWEITQKLPNIATSRITIRFIHLLLGISKWIEK